MSGTIYGMWIPCVVFAHVFAAYFLLRVLLMMYPNLWHSMMKHWKRRFAAGTTGHADKHGTIAPGMLPSICLH